MSSILVVSVVAWLSSGGQGQPEEPALPGEVRAALEKNAAALSDLRISGVRRQRLLGDAAAVLKIVAPRSTERDFTQEVAFELRLQGPRFAQSLRYPPGDFLPVERVETTSFDGEKYFSGSSRPTDSDAPGAYAIHTAKTLVARRPQGEPEDPIVEAWYLHEAGFDIPARPSELGQAVKSLVLERLSAGRLRSVKRAEREGQAVLEVEIAYPEPWASPRRTPIDKDPRFLRFSSPAMREMHMRIERERRELSGQSRVCRLLLDPRLNYAVREESERRGAEGEVMFRTVNSDFAKLETADVWLPRRSECVAHASDMSPKTVSAKPLYATEYQVTGISRQQFDTADFRVSPDRPGVIVSDFTHPRASPGQPISYPIAVPGEALEEFRRPAIARWPLILLNVAAAVVLVSLWYRRSRKSA